MLNYYKMASIFGKQPDKLTLVDYTIILPTDSPKPGDVMHIAYIDETNHLIYFEWSEKSSDTETEFSNARIKYKLW